MGAMRNPETTLFNGRNGPRYAVGETTGCWLWFGSLTHDGYAQFGGPWCKRRGLTTRYAHVLYWEYVNGPIPTGLELDHLCGRRDCVNPAHLEPVSHRENLMRGDTQAARNAAKTHCPSGHLLSGDNLYVCRGQRQCRECRRRHDRARRPSRLVPEDCKLVASSPGKL